MAEPFLGEIRIFAGNFAPRGWALCNGQILAISQNTALFSLLGTFYGGNGTSTFALPDLRGRLAVNQGQGPGLSSYTIGEQTGTESVTLLTTNMPAHTHLINASTGAADLGSPAGAVLAVPYDSTGVAGTGYTKTPANTQMAPNAVGLAGGSQPFSILQPLLAVTFIIALQGIFPSRN
jgi:microcystin-dependent protein